MEHYVAGPAPRNVRHFPLSPRSCLRHADATTGISVPWLYFGMCMSTFCWHVEAGTTDKVTDAHQVILHVLFPRAIA